MIKTNTRKSLYMGIAFLFFSIGAFAQTTTSWITGRVQGTDGADLVGSTVIAIHVPTGTKYGVSTRLDGGYDIPNAKIGGPYSVEVSFVGFKSQKVEGVFLTLGQKQRLDFVLQEDATTIQEVVITANRDDVMNSERTGAETTISNDQLVLLPTISRSTQDIFRLTPSNDGNGFAGRSDHDTNFSLDGSIFNNPFGLDAATPGGQAGAQPISLDAIDQIQVSVAPFDVTKAGFTGASVDAVTKSGTNALKGTAFGFYRNQAMTGKKVNGTSIDVPDLTQFQGGFSLGGPIIKNKLFFFANMEMERREDLGQNVVADNGSNSGESNVARVSEADLIAVQSALRSIGHDPGDYQGYTHKTENLKAMLKIDWNINDKHSLTATYNMLDANRDLPAHPNAIIRRGPDRTTMQFENSGYNIENKIQSGMLELNSIFSNTVSNKLQVGMTMFRDARDPKSEPFPDLNIANNTINYIVAGHEPFSIHNRLDQDVIQITNNVNIFKGAHTFTVGGSFEKFMFDNSFNLGAYGGTFGPAYSSVAQFQDSIASGYIAGQKAAAEALFASNNAATPDTGGWALAETNVGQLSFYAQDEWQATDNLALTFGLRMDVPLYFDTEEKMQENIDRNCCYDPSIQYYDENGDPIMFNSLEFPEQKPLFSPRFGFNWDVNGDRTVQVRGGTGLFTGRFPFVWIGNQVANPNFFFYTVSRTDFKFPQVWKTNLGVDKKLGEGFTLSADLVYSKDVNGIMVRNYGLIQPNSTLSGQPGRQVYGAGDRATVFGGATNAYVLSNSDVGRSVNLSLELKKSWTNGLYTSLAYNFLDSKDASSLVGEISSDTYDRNPAINNVNEAVASPSLYGNRHRIVGTINKKFTYGGDKTATTVSFFIEYAQGGRFSYTYAGDINNDGSGLNDLIYVPTDGEIDQMQFDTFFATEADQRAGLKSYIAQDEYLNVRRGRYAEKYSALSPWFSTWDMRVLQDFYIGEQTLQLSLDILNIGNLISNKWGVRQVPLNTSPIGYVRTEATGEPVYSFDTNAKETFADDFGLQSRWQLQLGVRYIF
ncbi:MAG: carboxypeptidase regulatory-like domain-containing protein [Reichenbachiella sp.]|uniref:TonB-dependent receptor n=1 Tax=Reichenbachiella sp. TaxID=2184521 RepID=UPI00296762F7|nr:carboxypeptidase regulatory-like domain-containing protein [Reichenbachiella sp.]MDW3210461.1 carboxypeptidase regulatory-like domain-containing protein [Reichenbachiella sp.]